MAKHVIIESYTFNPSTRTVTVNGKNIRKEQLLLITNTTLGTVLYNFSDPSLQATSYTNASNTATGLETTTIVLSFATGSMSASDKLSILTEETYQEITPAEVYRDPVDKIRVSEPQALIDTDFEYGPQPTKWESINLTNNRPSCFYDPTQGISNTPANTTFYNAAGTYQVTNVTSVGKLVTVAINNTQGITAGTPVFIQGTLDNANVDGWWIVEGVSPNASFNFTVTITPTTTALFDATKTYVFMGSFYSGAALPTSAVSGGTIVLNSTVATVTTANAHGLRAGDGIYVVGATGNTGLINSSWTVANTPNTNILTFQCTASGTIVTSSNASIYMRPLGYTVHRPFDGGVQFSNETPYHGYQVIRQTRRQFRYQSGKGMQFSTGSILKPSVTVDTITSTGTTVTVSTKYAHGMNANCQIIVSGADETAYNGLFTITGANTLYQFTYTSNTVPTATTATGFPINVSPYAWYGSSNRIGMYDSQNGFFFEYDGQTLYCVKRSSTQQISGFGTVISANGAVGGVSTKFSSQLKPGDFVVIRGQSYLVQTIASDTLMYIYPEYRGTSTIHCVISKTIDTRVPQSQWNIDRCDGTGASLYNIDLTKMQMFYADYSWYGAGAIRFGFKNNRGEVIYAHRITNNNVNYEAYMRSGNLPARYETNTLSVRTYLTATLAAGATTITVNDTSAFPPAGIIVVTAAADTGGAIEYISYTGKTGTTFTGLGRNVNTLIGTGFQRGGGNPTATTFTYSATAPIGVELYSPQNASQVSHWGSSVIMDGKYDDDKSFLFNYGQNQSQAYVNQNQRYPVFSIRLSPSVDNGLTGVLGQREIINRMQLAPAAMGIFTSGNAVRTELVLNGRVNQGTYQSIGGSSLAQFAVHGPTANIYGGESIFTFFAAANNTTSQDLTKLRDIGNSILGGGITNAVSNTTTSIYPDGPDTLTICITPVGGSANVAARMMWTEAQA
jgi:hypothetical protein